MKLPTLEGPTLLLRPAQPDDFAALLAAASDPEIWRQHPEPTRHLEPVFRKFFDSALAGGLSLTVREQATGHVIGSSRFYDWDAAHREVAIGYTFLIRAHWGGATNRELKQLMLDWALQHADRVWFHVGKNNRRSARAMEKIGAVLNHEENRPSGDGFEPYLYYRFDRGMPLPRFNTPRS